MPIGVLVPCLPLRAVPVGNRVWGGTYGTTRVSPSIRTDGRIRSVYTVGANAPSIRMDGLWDPVPYGNRPDSGQGTNTLRKVRPAAMALVEALFNR